MLDHVVSEGVLISDSSRDFSIPLVIVDKRDGGICIAVVYRSKYAAGDYSKSVSLSAHCFKDWVVKGFMQKLTIFEDIINRV